MEKITPSVARVFFNGQTHRIRYYDFSVERRVVRADVVQSAGYSLPSGSYRFVDQNLTEYVVLNTSHHCLQPVAFWSAEQVEQFAYNPQKTAKKIHRREAGEAILAQVFGRATVKAAPVRQSARREIKFRGVTSRGRFVYGWYNRDGDSVGIILPNQLEVEVDPGSVAQLIGVDANGDEVYEGDRVTRVKDYPDGTPFEPGMTFAATFEDYGAIRDGEVVKFKEAQS